MNQFTRFAISVAMLACAMFAQETRSSIRGKVLDAQGASISGATVTIRNTDTGVTTNLKSNDTGYYEANLLLPGQYEVVGEFAGFNGFLNF